MDKSTTSLPVHITSSSYKIDEDLKIEFNYIENMTIIGFVYLL
jgi:hypothetical protein